MEVNKTFWKKGQVPVIQSCKEKIDLTNISSFGSCFSRNIYRWLYNSQLVRIENSWEILYNPYSVYYEISRLFNDIDWKSHVIVEKFANGTTYTDPWRTWISAPDMPTLESLNDKQDAIAFKQLTSSKTILITFGLIEVWRERLSSGVVVNELPYNLIKCGGHKDLYFRTILDLSEVTEIIKKTVELLTRELGNHINIVFTLSPVPLKYSFFGSLREVNNLSKAIQLIAIHRVCPLFKNVFYFPSYEIVQALSESDYEAVWQKDDRHITASAIGKIAQMFSVFCSVEMPVTDSMFFVPLVDERGKIYGKLFLDGKKEIE